jgi:opine dehydrogenase
MLAVPAIGAEAFFRSILPFLEDGQIIIKWSANFSTLCFVNIMRQQGIKKDITLAETHTLPWGCRMVAPATIQVMVWAVKLLLATFPATKTESVINDVQKMYPVVAGENVLATSLNNLNPVVHPVGTVMNAGWIDAVGEDFFLYRDGNTLSISRGIKAVFNEVTEVAHALDVSMIEYPEENFWKKSAIMSTYFRANFDKEGAVAKISGPSSVKSRYIEEDIPFGLVPISKLAKKFGVDTPLIDGVIEFACVINQTDYWQEGLSLKDLGLDNLNRDECQKFLKQGF